MSTFNDELRAFVEERIEKYNQEVYKGDMCSHSKGVLRKMIIAEDEFELRQQTKEDRMSKWVGL